MSHSQFHCTGRVYLDLHGLIFETSICYWQDQPGSPGSTGRRGKRPARPAPREMRVRTSATPAPSGEEGQAGETEASELRVTGEGIAPAGWGGHGESPRGVGFEKTCLPEGAAACVRRGRGRPGARARLSKLQNPAAGSVGGLLGQTGRLGLATERSAGGRGAPRRSRDPPGHGGEPAGRRNRPPEHQREAGRRGPSDGGSRLPIGQWRKSDENGK